MKRIVDWLFRNRETGRITVAQWPNAPLWVFIVARTGAAMTGWSWLDVIGTVALVVWAILEVWKGVNPFRRLIGGLVLTAVVAGFIIR